jgi:hypothetical protein
MKLTLARSSSEISKKVMYFILVASDMRFGYRSFSYLTAIFHLSLTDDNNSFLIVKQSLIFWMFLQHQTRKSVEYRALILVKTIIQRVAEVTLWRQASFLFQPKLTLVPMQIVFNPLTILQLQYVFRTLKLA